MTTEERCKGKILRGKPTKKLPRSRQFWMRARLFSIGGIMTLALLAIAAKAWKVQIVEGAGLRDKGLAQYAKERTVSFPRGIIYDANGKELAVSANVSSIFANPKMIANVADTSEQLARILKLDVREVEAKLGLERYFVWLKRHVSDEQAKQIADAGFAGVFLKQEARRYYPAKNLAGPVLGFASIDNVGLEGLELTLDKYLRMEEEAIPAWRDAKGQMLLANGTAKENAAAAYLTIDWFIQMAAERALKKSVQENDATSGLALVMDPSSGEIRAIANWPTFDPNQRGSKGDARNRTVTDTFEPGSVMKTFHVAAAIEDGLVTPQSQIDVQKGRMRVSRRLMVRDTHEGEDLLSISDIVKYSSNVGMVKLMRRRTQEQIRESLAAFGFGTKTGVELPGEERGLIHKRKWGEEGLATMAYGYGMTATPMQILSAMAAIANGGVYRKPTIIKRIVDQHGKRVVETNTESRRVVSEKTARDVANILKTVLEKGGTASKLEMGGFVAAGKTGTSIKFDPETKRYFKDKYIGSFTGFVPADDPKLAILVLIDEPKGEHYYGGLVAGPVFADIAKESLKYLGVAPTQIEPEELETSPMVAYDPQLAERIAEKERELLQKLEESAEKPEEELPPAGPGHPIVVIPDFSGLSMVEALALAKNAGVQVSLKGSGRAVEQFPAAGRALRSVTCNIRFEPG